MTRRRAIGIAFAALLAAALVVGSVSRVSAHGGGDTSNKASDIVKQYSRPRKERRCAQS
jgi:hypothetical protein